MACKAAAAVDALEAASLRSGAASLGPVVKTLRGAITSGFWQSLLEPATDDSEMTSRVAPLVASIAGQVRL
jgi:hypothetical protein